MLLGASYGEPEIVYFWALSSKMSQGYRDIESFIIIQAYWYFKAI